MADFPAPAEGIVLTHFLVSGDVGRSRAFYTEVLGGEALMDGEPTIVARRSAATCVTPTVTSSRSGRADGESRPRHHAPASLEGETSVRARDRDAALADGYHRPPGVVVRLCSR